MVNRYRRNRGLWSTFVAFYGVVFTLYVFFALFAPVAEPEWFSRLMLLLMFVGVWGTMLLMSCCGCLNAWYSVLLVGRRSICERGILGRRRMNYSEVERIRWSGRKALLVGMKSRISIELSNASYASYSADTVWQVVHVLRDAVPPERHENWAQFCHEVALPLRSRRCGMPRREELLCPPTERIPRWRFDAFVTAMATTVVFFAGWIYVISGLLEQTLYALLVSVAVAAIGYCYRKTIPPDGTLVEKIDLPPVPFPWTSLAFWTLIVIGAFVVTFGKIGWPQSPMERDLFFILWICGAALLFFPWIAKQTRRRSTHQMAACERAARLWDELESRSKELPSTLAPAELQ